MAGLFQSNIGAGAVGVEQVQAETSPLSVIADVGATILKGATQLGDALQTNKVDQFKNELDTLWQQKESGSISNSQFNVKANSLYTDFRSKNDIELAGQVKPIMGEYGISSAEMVSTTDLEDIQFESYIQNNPQKVAIANGMFMDENGVVDTEKSKDYLRSDYLSGLKREHEATTRSKAAASEVSYFESVKNDKGLHLQYFEASKMAIDSLVNNQLKTASSKYGSVAEYAQFSAQSDQMINTLRKQVFDQFNRENRTNFSDDELDTMIPVFKDAKVRLKNDWETISSLTSNLKEAGELYTQMSSYEAIGSAGLAPETLKMAGQMVAMAERTNITRGVREAGESITGQFVPKTVEQTLLETPATTNTAEIIRPDAAVQVDSNGNPTNISVKGENPFNQELINKTYINEGGVIDQKKVTRHITDLEKVVNGLRVEQIRNNPELASTNANAMLGILTAMSTSTTPLNQKSIQMVFDPNRLKALKETIPSEQYDQLITGLSYVARKNTGDDITLTQNYLNGKFGENVVKISITDDGRVTNEIDTDVLTNFESKDSGYVKDTLSQMRLESYGFRKPTPFLMDKYGKEDLPEVAMTAITKLSGSYLTRKEATDQLLKLNEVSFSNPKVKDILEDVRPNVMSNSNDHYAIVPLEREEEFKNLLKTNIQLELSKRDSKMLGLSSEDNAYVSATNRTTAYIKTLLKVDPELGKDVLNNVKELTGQIPAGISQNTKTAIDNTLQEVATQPVSTDTTATGVTIPEVTTTVLSDYVNDGQEIKTTTGSSFVFNSDDVTSTTTSLMNALTTDTGMTKAAAAGLLGNVLHETGNFKYYQEINPTVKGSRGGAGWLQWTGPRRKEFEAWAENNNRDTKDPATNYDYLLVEMETGNHWSKGSSFEEFKKLNDPTEAAIYFEKNYERPSAGSTDKRTANALAVFAGESIDSASYRPSRGGNTSEVTTQSAQQDTMTSQTTQNLVSEIGGPVQIDTDRYKEILPTAGKSLDTAVNQSASTEERLMGIKDTVAAVVQQPMSQELRDLVMKLLDLQEELEK